MQGETIDKKNALQINIIKCKDNHKNILLLNYIHPTTDHVTFFRIETAVVCS